MKIRLPVLILLAVFLQACNTAPQCPATPEPFMKQLMKAYQQKNFAGVVSLYDLDKLAKTQVINNPPTEPKKFRERLKQFYSKSGYPDHWGSTCKRKLTRYNAAKYGVAVNCDWKDKSILYASYTWERRRCQWKLVNYAVFKDTSDRSKLPRSRSY